MAKDGSMEFDAQIKTAAFQADLKDMVKSASDSTDDIQEKAERMWKAVLSSRSKLSSEYQKLGMDASEANKKAWEEVKKTAEYESAQAAKAAAKAAQSAEQEVDTFSSHAKKSFSPVADAAEDAMDDVVISVSDASGNMCQSMYDALDGMESTAKDTFSRIAAAAGTALTVDYVVDVGTDFDKGFNQLAASTDIAGGKLEDLQEIAQQIYKNNFGDSMEEVADSLSAVYKATGLTGDELQRAVENGYLLRDTFGYELTDSTRAVSAMMKNFGITSEEAYNLIAVGAQQGADQNDNLLDTLNEYATQYAALGLSADQFMQSLISGTEAGVFDIDKVGDAVKEFNIRAKDGSDSSITAFGALGYSAGTNAKEIAECAETIADLEQNLKYARMEQEGFTEKTSELTRMKNAGKIEEYSQQLENAQAKLASLQTASEDGSKTVDQLMTQFASGGEQAESALFEVLDALQAIEDPVERNNIAVSLFGTQFEDLEQNILPVLSSMQGTGDVAYDALTHMNEVKYDDLESMLSSLKRTIETDVIYPFIKEHMPEIKEGLQWVTEHLDEIIEAAKPIAAAIGAAFAAKKVMEFASAVGGIGSALKGLLSMSNPLGLILTTLSAIVGFAVWLENGDQSPFLTELDAIGEEAAKLTEEMQELKERTEEAEKEWDQISTSNTKAEKEVELKYDEVTEAKRVLDLLIDDSGHVVGTMSQEAQAQLDIINGYLGTNYEIVDGLLTKGGEVLTQYQEISAELDALIAKQHAQSMLNAHQESYSTAKSNQQQAAADAAEAGNRKKDLEEIVRSKQQTLRYLESELAKLGVASDKNGLYSPFASSEEQKKLAEAHDKLLAQLQGTDSEKGFLAQLEEQNQLYDDASELLSKYTTEVSNYESLEKAVLSGDMDDVEKYTMMLRDSMKTAGNATKEELTEQRDTYKEHYYALLEAAKNGNEQITDEMVQSAKEQWDAAEDELDQLVLLYNEKGQQAIDGFISNLQSGIEMTEAVSRLIRDAAIAGLSLDDIAAAMGIDFQSGFAEEYTNTAGLEEANKAFRKSLEGGMRDELEIHSPSHLSARIASDFNAGFINTVYDGAEDARNASVTFANDAASGLISAAGASSYPVVQQSVGQQPIPADGVSAGSAATGDIIIPVTIGGELIETIVVDAAAHANAVTGGRSI